MNFRLPPIQEFSFWLGVMVATIFWWLMAAFRPAFQHILETLREKRAAEKERKARMPSAVEEHYRQAILLRAQGMHLAAPLFALDEIIEPPLLLAPPPRVEPGLPNPPEDIVSSTVPYLPPWPELAAVYRAPTLTLAEALSGESDIVLTGRAGTGKTVALAYLASRLARREPLPGIPEGTLPFLIHVADLDAVAPRADDPLFPLIDFIAEKAPLLDVGRIPEFVRGCFENKRALLLLDGTDEIPPAALQTVVEFIKAVKKRYPATRIIVTASPEYLDGLVTLNFVPLVMAAWDSSCRQRFIEKWGELWTRFVAVESWMQTGPEVIDPILLNRWLSGDNDFLTPLELTLKVWGAYAGDIRGPRPIDAIETHLRRLAPANAPATALELLAMQAHLSAEPIFDPRAAREWIKSFEPPASAPETATAEENPPASVPGTKNSKAQAVAAPSSGLIASMVNSGLLSQHRNNRIRFVHPLFGGYLAGKALAAYKAEAILDQPPWAGKYLALHYLAAYGDVSAILEKMLAQIDRPLHRNVLIPARWLRDAPRQASWKSKLMKKLAELLQAEGQPLGLRGQALAAFVVSGDPGAAALFRQFYRAVSGELIQLAALGSGAVQDAKAIDGLSGLLNNPNPGVRRAACLALVNIGTTAALESVAYVLLHGEEDLRRAAAEALANDPREGYAMLRDAVEMKDDLMVRRAAVYGLGRVNQPWADELLTRLQTDDPEWVVRNSAVEVVESRQVINPRIPRRLPLPSESPWLIEFASKQGLGVAPDKPPIDLLLMALKSGNEEERLASLAYLRILPLEGVFGALYQAMYAGTSELRDAIFLIIWEMAGRGIEIPDPVQFGVGY
jgi:HEAT repeat protein